MLQKTKILSLVRSSLFRLAICGLRFPVTSSFQKAPRTMDGIINGRAVYFSIPQKRDAAGNNHFGNGEPSGGGVGEAVLTTERRCGYQQRTQYGPLGSSSSPNMVSMGLPLGIQIQSQSSTNRNFLILIPHSPDPNRLQIKPLCQMHHLHVLNLRINGH